MSDPRIPPPAPDRALSESRRHGDGEPLVQRPARADLLVYLNVKEKTKKTKVRGNPIDREDAGTVRPDLVRKNYIDGHKIDYVKECVAFDLEWNSKDQTFDRDLYAFRAFHEAGIISAGVLLTRSSELNAVFRALEVAHKYGSSTTWMGKLLYRIEAGRAGGCPVLAIGIRQPAISDWEEWKRLNPEEASSPIPDDAPIPDDPEELKHD